MNRLTSPRWLIALLLVLAATPAPAQTQNCQKSQEDLTAVRDMKDIGLDVALVVSEQATIREQPNATSRALRGVKRADALALVKREPTRAWYKVIEIDSATEGWINDCDVIIKLTTNKEQGPPLEEERGTTADSAELSVSNLEPVTDLSLRLNGTLYVVPHNSSKTFTLKPGRYDFYAFSPGIRPAFGGENFKAGIRYSWTFHIVQH